MPPQSSGPSWSELRKELLALEKLELIALIQDLYKLNNDNKLFLATRFTETDLATIQNINSNGYREKMNGVIEN